MRISLLTLTALGLVLTFALPAQAQVLKGRGGNEGIILQGGHTAPNVKPQQSPNGIVIEGNQAGLPNPEATKKPKHSGQPTKNGIILQNGLIVQGGLHEKHGGGLSQDQGMRAIGPKPDDPGRGNGDKHSIGPKHDDLRHGGLASLGPKPDDPSGGGEGGKVSIGPKPDEPGRNHGDKVAIGPKQDDPSAPGRRTAHGLDDGSNDVGGKPQTPRKAPHKTSLKSGKTSHLSIGPKPEDPSSGAKSSHGATDDPSMGGTMHFNN